MLIGETKQKARSETGDIWWMYIVHYDSGSKELSFSTADSALTYKPSCRFHCDAVFSRLAAGPVCFTNQL